MELRDRWLYGWGVGYAAVGGASLLVPLYALALGGGPTLVGLLAAAAAFAGVPGAVLWGWLAGRTRRKRPFLLVTLGATALVLAVAPFLARPWPLLAANAALWFAVSAAAPVSNLVMVDGVPEGEWESRIGLLNAYQGYGWVAGLALGTVWTVIAPPVLGQLLALRALFAVLAVTAAVGGVLVYRRYPDPVRLSDVYFRRVYRRLSREGWGSGRVLRTVPYGPSRVYWGLATLRPERVRGLATPLGRYLAAVTLFSVGFAVFWGPMPAYLTVEGFDEGTTFLLFLVGNLGSAVTYTRVARLADRTGPGPAQALALAGRVVLFPVVGVVGGLAFGAVALAACFALIGVSWAVIAVTTTTLVTRLAAPTARGEAFGAQAALVGVGSGLGSVAGGALASALSYPVAFALAAVIVLLGAGALVATGDRVASSTVGAGAAGSGDGGRL